MTCPVCEDGTTLEADGQCAQCGRRGACAACTDNDCWHLEIAGHVTDWKRARP